MHLDFTSDSAVKGQQIETPRLSAMFAFMRPNLEYRTLPTRIGAACVTTMRRGKYYLFKCESFGSARLAVHSLVIASEEFLSAD